MHYKALLLLTFFISSELKSEIVIDPGEMVAIKISTCPDIKNKEIFFYTFNKIEYAIVPSPFSKNSKVINSYCVPIKINKKDFGESRITILDVSKVNLSAEDSQRAYKESQLIRESLNSYSTNIKPSLKFISPVDGIISSRYGKQRYINDKHRSPHLELETGVVSLFTIPFEYILEDVSDSWEDTLYESSVAESPRSSSGYSPLSPVGGGKVTRGSRKLSRGGNLFSVINSSTYSSTVISTLLQDLNGILNECFKVIHGSENFLSKSEETMIINEYIKLTQQDKRKWYFVGPQPVSMGTEHLNPYNPNSILSGYAVTEKADGIRAELLIVEGKGYLITPKKQIISTGVTFDTNYTWIFDGEYITQNKRGESIQLYMIFDVYYCNQSPTNPHTLPWYVKSGDSRSSIINEFKQSVAIELSENSMRIDFKQYYEGPLKLTEKNGEFKNLTAMLKYAKKILDKETVGGYEYFTDGLIFLPTDLPVKGKVVGESVTSIKGTWPLNYKWKPPEENTIDFKVIYMKDKGRNITHTYTKESEDGRKSIERYQKVQLIVGYKETDDSGIDYNWYQMTNKPPNKSNYQQFNPHENKLKISI